MEWISITVECHSGYKADEYPERFIWNDAVHEIIEIVDRWYQGDRNPDYPVSNYFRVKTSDHKHHLLRHEVQSDAWHICQ
jgi:hypothetical protein